MLKKALLALIILAVVPMGLGFAQDEEQLTLHLRRTFGYRAGGVIQGSFNLEVSGNENMRLVQFLLDEVVMATVVQAPFKTTFSTADYQPGDHRLWAQGVGVDGSEVRSQIVRVTFITAEDSWGAASRISAWVLGGVLGLMLLGMIMSGLLARGGRRFELGAYGAAGAAVCARCRLPFGRHFLSPNLMFGKLERCPHCGKVAIVPRADRAALDEAEARYRADQVEGQHAIRSEPGGYAQKLEDSRFEG